MTTTPGASEAMTEARRLYLAFLPGRLRQIRPAQDADLIAAADHIDAQAAEIAALRKKTQICMGVGDGAGNLFVYGDHESIKAAQNIVLRLGESAREIAALKAALRDAFPHFQNDEPITAEAIKGVGKEHVDMIMGWAPVRERIEFTDDDGEAFAIVYEHGDFEAGIPAGWCVPEDADWQPAPRDQVAALKAELATARNDVLEEAALLVETTVISGPEDDEIDHDDYRDTQMAFAIRALKRQTP